MEHYIIIIYIIINQIFLQAHSMQNGMSPNCQQECPTFHWELKFVQITVVFRYYLTSYQNLKKKNTDVGLFYWTMIL